MGRAPLHAIRAVGPRVRGYVLVPVVLGLSLIAITALLLSSESAMGTAETGGLLEARAAEDLARSGVERAVWRAQHDGCQGDFVIASTSMGGGDYSVSATGAGSPTTYQFTVDRDAWIRNDDVDRNNGSSSWNHIRAESGNYEQVLTHFDLSALPAGAQIQSATAWFYIKTLQPHPEGDIAVHAISADWTELGVTWSSFGGAYEASRIATIPAQDAGAVWVSFNLTGQVQAWANGRENHGILFETRAEGVHTEYTGRAEGTSPPRLEVVVAAAPMSPLVVKASGTTSRGTTRSYGRASVEAAQPVQTLALRPGASDSRDTYTWAANKTTNYETDDETWVATGNNNTANALFEFNLEVVPNGARILDATLSLHHRSGNDPDVPISAHRITNPWLESQATWNRRVNGTSWDAPGGDFDATPISTTLVGPTSNIRYEWDVKSLVRGWLEGDYPNYGLLLRTEAPGMFGERFDTSDHADPTRRPTLTIRYGCECGRTCLAPQSNGSILMAIGDSPANPSTRDEAIIDVFESWGYAVTLIQDDDSSGNFASGATAADVVFVSRSVRANNVGTKLTNVSTGVVTADPNLVDELGISTGDSSTASATVDVVETDHFITSVFVAGTKPFQRASTTLNTVGGALAPGATVLAEVGSVGSLVVLDTGASLSSGGTAAGPRALVPARDGDEWDLLTNEGRLMIQRTLAWASGDGAIVLPGLLLVVANDGALTAEESAKKSQIESWGYAVSLIDQDDNQAAFDAALVDQSVVFITEDVTASAVGTKLVDATIGVVTEETNLADEFGFASGIAWDSGTTLVIEDSSHYITQPFAVGPLQVTSVSESFAMMEVGEVTFAPLLQKLAWHEDGWSIAALPAGFETWDGETTAGRRVFLPWGGNDMSLASLNADGLTIFQRSLEWAAGASLPPPIPLAHWKLDDAGGTTALDSVGSHDGTLVNGPSWIPGQIDGAVQLDGTNDYVEVPHDAGLDLTSFSVSTWVNPDVVGGWHVLLHKGTTPNVSNYYLGIYNGSPIAGYFSTVWVEFWGGPSVVRPKMWQHLVFTYDDTTRRGTLYQDGEVIHSSVATRSPVSNSDDLWIGATGLGEYWSGGLDDVRLYADVLGPSQVIELMADGGGAAFGGGGGGGGSGGPCNGSYLDSFDTRVFDGSHGSIDWTGTPWEEIKETNGPTGGDVIVMTDESNYQLRVRDNDYGATRLVNLDGATTASLSLTYRRHQLDNSGDYVALSISTNGTAGPWTELTVFGTDNDASYQPYSVDITAHIDADTAIRLLSSSGMGNQDQVYFDDIQISCAP